MDWSEKQIVASENKRLIVFTDGTCTENRFGGTIVWADDNTGIGRHIPDFYKHAYKPCRLTINFE